MAVNAPQGASRRLRLSSPAVVAGCQVSTGGRIWVSTEGETREGSETRVVRGVGFSCRPTGGHVNRGARGHHVMRSDASALADPSFRGLERSPSNGHRLLRKPGSYATERSGGTP
jgi:hypothetical protein